MTILRALAAALFAAILMSGCATMMGVPGRDAAFDAYINSNRFDGQVSAESDETAALRRRAEAAERREQEALAIAREASNRLEERETWNPEAELAQSYSAPRLAAAIMSPSQVMPRTGAVMYVDRLPPMTAREDTIQIRCNGSGTCRSWLLVLLGNELPSVSMDGQHPYPMRVRIGEATTAFHLLPPGSTGYIVPDQPSYTVIRVVAFEGDPFSATGLRFKGVATIDGYHAAHPFGRMFTDAGVIDAGGHVEAVKELLLRIAPLP